MQDSSSLSDCELTGLNGQKAKWQLANEDTVSLNESPTQPDFLTSDDDSKLPDDDSASDSSVQLTPYIPPLRSKL